LKILKKLNWKIDIASAIGTIVLFEIIDRSLNFIHPESIQYELLSTAKWLIVGGLLVHAVINYLISRTTKAESSTQKND
jgi:hypothetical protein